MIAPRYYVDGKPVAQDDFVVSADDSGFLRGLAVFETLRSCKGRFFRAPQHLDRLMDGLRSFGIASPSKQQLEAELIQAIADYPVDSKVRITLTDGGRRLVEVSPLDLDAVGRTLRVAVFEWEPPRWLSGRIKHCSRAVAQVAQRQANVDEIVWIGRDGCLTEANRSNIFAVVGGVLVTPPDDGRILCGVTRGALLEVAKAHGIPVCEGPLRPSDNMSELYASSTLKHLSPIVEMDGKSAPGSGPIGDRIAALLAQLIEFECSPTRPTAPL
jgi:branched-subunit amino acid aminotransferase/4-amino-4-deoxychorismate lyase